VLNDYQRYMDNNLPRENQKLVSKQKEGRAFLAHFFELLKLEKWAAGDLKSSEKEDLTALLAGAEQELRAHEEAVSGKAIGAESTLP
jgi:hypothetical protein